MWLSRLVTQTPKDRKLRAGIAVATLTITGLSIMIGSALRVLPATTTVLDLPVYLRPVAYLVSALFVWSAFQLFYDLIPDVFHRHFHAWTKLIWICALLAWPLGPLVYFLLVISKEADGQPTYRTGNL